MCRLLAPVLIVHRLHLFFFFFCCGNLQNYWSKQGKRYAPLSSLYYLDVYALHTLIASLSGDGENKKWFWINKPTQNPRAERIEYRPTAVEFKLDCGLISKLEKRSRLSGGFPPPSSDYFWANHRDGCYYDHSVQRILKGEVSLYRWPPVWLVWIRLFCK
jgi:hypothetical protein